jgi:UDP-N-acetylmuramoylalanine--D-glutamate ligase
MSEEWRGKRVTVMGLGSFGGGSAVTRWLAEQGAEVTVTDLKPDRELRNSLSGISDLRVTLRLGFHAEEDFTEAELVVANPAVPPRSQYLALANDAGVPITTEVNLFLERCPAPVVGITGSVGKSTITAMTAHVLEQVLPDRKVWVGGNIGKSLLNNLERITSDDLIVLELSSFQLHYTPLIRWSPHIAVITNVTPNHIDWHGNFAAYLADKLNIIRYQDPERDVIIIEETPEHHHNFDLMFGDVAGIWRYEADADVLKATMQTSSGLEADDRQLSWEGVQLKIPGRHNRENAAAALTVATALGADQQAAIAAAGSFEGLPHRLCHVADVFGVRYIDDSKSTTPEALLTALDAIEGPVLVIVGGYDKGSELGVAMQRLAERAKYVSCIGDTGQDWQAGLRDLGVDCDYHKTMDIAVSACAYRAKPGDTVLLSPACASWGMFRDYRLRGEAFAKAVKGLRVTL